MKKAYIFSAVVAMMISVAVALWANPSIQQQHLLMIDMQGGCGYCHNPKTKIQQSKSGFLKGQKNYSKIGTFKSAGCTRCHTKTGLTPAGQSAKEDAGL